MIRDVAVDDMDVRDAVTRLRGRFLDMRFCFSGGEIDGLVDKVFAAA